MKRRWVLKRLDTSTYRGSSRWSWVPSLDRAKVFTRRVPNAFGYKKGTKGYKWVEVEIVEKADV